MNDPLKEIGVKFIVQDRDAKHADEEIKRAKEALLHETEKYLRHEMHHDSNRRATYHILRLTVYSL